MLELRSISKVYDTGGLKQKALDSVSLKFSESEFTSILGPSGSGKTTLLNIIGGLDSYTSGDLIIKGVSTKQFKDSDWDAYRNHRVGFVFQSYNLIPHQTILNNVRLALTLSGISRREGLRRAKDALKSVGLGAHIHKRPAQLSGGQMQRVAIARALVNDPDILLADEPTGALDSETSLQIMKLLREIASTRLVVMVTHNPDLAKEYSTRIITLKDGKITSDHQNFERGTNLRKKSAVTATKQGENTHKSRKTKMSFLTALSLSFNNLMTKKGRTILVAFAGSIGIIGIALILAVSTGFKRYVDSIEENTLSSYPLTITEESFSLDAILTAEVEETEANSSADIVEYPALTRTLSTIATNDLKSFREYYESHRSLTKNDVKNVSYGYSVDPLIYTIDKTNALARLNPNNIFSSIYGSNSMMSSFSTYSSIFSQLPDDKETLEEFYDVLAGHWPENYDEIVVILPYADTISDLLAYSLGLKDTSELSSLVSKLMSGERVAAPKDSELLRLNYDDLLGLDLRMIIPTDLYKYNEKYDVYEDMSGDDAFLKDVYEGKAVKLKVVGVMTSKENSLTSGADSGVGYCSGLIQYIINTVKDTPVVKRQLENEDVDVFSGKRFDEATSFDYGFEDLVSVDESALMGVFEIKLDQKSLNAEVEKYMTDIASSISVDTTPAKESFLGAYDSLATLLGAELSTYKTENPDAPLEPDDVEKFVENFLLQYSPSEVLNGLSEEYALPSDVFRAVFQGTFSTLLASYLPVADFIPFETVVGGAKETELFVSLAEQMSGKMTEGKITKEVLSDVGGLVAYLSDAFAKSFNLDASKFASAFHLNFSEDELMRVMNAMLNSSDSTQKDNLLALGYQDLASPSYISFYFTSFDGKTNFLKFIEDYNEAVSDEKKINYSDITGVLMNSVKVIVDAVSYVLIAFVSISLVVSSIMIGIITYISVYERTKEIGILRAIGASKHNISSIFNAETFIVGLLSGVFGIMTSYLVIPIINGILKTLTNGVNIYAYLNPSSALKLIILSVFLTLIGGLIPARAAAKKDPVEALRTE